MALLNLPGATVPGFQKAMVFVSELMRGRLEERSGAPEETWW